VAFCLEMTAAPASALTSMNGLNLVLTLLFYSLRALGRSRSDVLFENLVLRQQINALIQTKPLPRLPPEERILWVALRRKWSRWQDALLLVQPETVVAWHRKAFRRYWTVLSRAPGRPRLEPEVRRLIVRMACENPTWGSPRIHGELAKLGFNVSERTVSRYLPRIRPGRGTIRAWGTFLRNHREALAAMDFFAVPTVGFRVLYVWFVLAHGRRQLMHFNVTANPTAPWVVQLLREAFSEASAPAYLVHDRDSVFSNKVREAIHGFGMEPVRTAYRSPWQNGIAERWVGTCRRELLDHVIVLNERHLYRRLREYVAYCNAGRVHTWLRDAPERRPLESRPSHGAKVVGLPRVCGLHHRYVWQEAA